MKIIYLHQYFNTPEMTGGTRSYEMARRMVAKGHEVHMVTSYREEDSLYRGWFVTEEAGIQVHWYPVPYANHMSFFERIKAFFAFAGAAKKKAVQLDGDVVFATSTPLTIALPAVPAARKKKVPLVFEVRDLWPEMPIAMGALKNPLLKFAAKQLEIWAYRNSNAIVALSPGMKEGVVSSGYASDKVAVIPNSSDNAEFAYDQQAGQFFRDKRSWLGKRPLFVYAGTFGKINGVDYMVEVASELKRLGSDICILVVGDGLFYDRVINKAKKEGVLNINFFIEEALPKKDMPALLSAATIASNLVIDLPEARANSANKFFDTLASGTPVFINHGGWMHNLVKNNNCGLPMWQYSVKEVALVLEEKMHDTAWLSAAGKAARNLAEEHFSRDQLARQLMDVIEVTVEGNPNQAATIAPGEYDK